MCAHYLVDADFCNVASGWEKGVVEKNVQDMTPSERSNAIAQLAIVLLQAAGVQAKEADDEQL